MRFDIVTLFPEMFTAIQDSGITKRALGRNLAQIHLWQLRDFASNAYRTIDDRPYGGGAGMVMSPEPLQKAVMAINDARPAIPPNAKRCICLSASGMPLTQAKCQALLQYQAITIICGRYEGIDQRFIDLFVDDEINVGDFVVSGGELPAMMLLDAIIRILPGAIGHSSLQEESFQPHHHPDFPEEPASPLLEYPHYTRPEVYAGKRVPSVLLSGNHAEIAHWRKIQALDRTRSKRPDLMQKTHTQAS